MARPLRVVERDVETIKARVEKNIMRASEIVDPWRGLVYGRPKVGKTRTLATMPDVLLIDVNDRGTRSTKRDLDPYVYIVNRFPEMDDIYWYLQAGDHSHQSFAIDGVTGLQALALRYVMNDEAERDASRDPNMPSKQVWGKANELVKDCITKYRNLPMHAGFSALERSREIGDDDDEEGERRIVISPAVSPGVANHLEAAVGTIGRLTAREVTVKDKQNKPLTVVRRSLFIGTSERMISGDRDNLWGSTVRNPHLGKMIQQAQGG